MKIYALTNSGLYTTRPTKTTNQQNGNRSNNVELFATPKSYITFGWCMPHLQAMKDINKQFNQAVYKAVKAQNAAIEDINAKKLHQYTKYGLIDDACAKAAKMFAQYCNIQYSVAEMLPSYALSLNDPLIEMMEKLEGINNPVNTLITINNLTKLNMQGGIDKNTSKIYTTEQVKKAKAGTQLYTTVLLLDRVKQQLKTQNINSSVKLQTEELISILEGKIDKIYGENTYNRIMRLSNIGSNPTLEQKRASVALIQEFDQKAQQLSLSGEFEEKLQKLIDCANLEEGKTLPNQGKGLSGSVDLKLAYHTHPHSQEIAHHHHHHPEMSEEEHRLYHLREEQERLKQELRKEQH